MAHTPKTWEVLASSIGANSRRIFSSDQYIATVGGSDQSTEDVEANAKLIAAAPELLQALRDLHDEQNDAPIEARRAEWQAAMNKAQELLKRLNG